MGHHSPPEEFQQGAWRIRCRTKPPSFLLLPSVRISSDEKAVAAFAAAYADKATGGISEPRPLMHSGLIFAPVMQDIVKCRNEIDKLDFDSKKSMTKLKI